MQRYQCEINIPGHRVSASLAGLGMGITVEVCQLGGKLPANQILFSVNSIRWKVFKHLVVDVIRANRTVM